MSAQEPAAPFSPDALAAFVRKALQRLADPAKAPLMAAYMKTDMPFYGVQKPDRIAMHRTMRTQFRPDSQEAYRDGVLALWHLAHREEKYAAIEFATQHKAHIGIASLPLYEQLIREGAWWDLVDPVATLLVGSVLLKHREQTHDVMEKWIADPDMWIRRAALLAHLKHKAQTDETQLFDHCLRLAPEKAFFLRKAIGWALREYSKTAPAAVRTFLRSHRDLLSPLSFREGAKHLLQAGIPVE
ncbi:MAG TPA: DNA alkylation repair protein [Noviherbaspirillum sp.]